MKRAKRLSTLAGTAATLAAALAGQASASTGPQIWARSGCAGCHTLAAAGATGQVGPNLDSLRPSSAAVAAQVTSGGGGMPSFASTLPSSDIEALATWLSSVAGTVSASSGTAATASHMSTTKVRRIQRELARLGYFHGPVTGFYGPLTTGAVKRFQRSAGLHPDGIWGPLSAAALSRRLRSRGMTALSKLLGRAHRPLIAAPENDPMKTKLAAAMSAGAIVIPVAQAAAATRTATQVASKKTVTKKVTGVSAVADRWGTVQVVITAQIVTNGSKKTVRYTDLGGSYSYHTDRSQFIMSQSLPTLRQEFLSGQTSSIQLVSGATATSDAFEQSLQSALLKLK